MSTQKSQILKFALKVHRGLLWLGGLALLAFVVSGLTHPLMTWIGPKPRAHRPPTMKLEPSALSRIGAILNQNQISKMSVTKIVPSEFGPLLMITESHHKEPRYFHLENGLEKTLHDRAQAEWLARYYTGLKTEPLLSITRQDRFDDTYPWVNRLLPVYRIAFETSDRVVAFIHTETSSAALISNTTKQWQQLIFQYLHSWTWLPKDGPWRGLVVGILALSSFAMAASGLSFLLLYRKRNGLSSGRRWHRRLAWALVIPIFALSLSGFIRLAQKELGGLPSPLTMPTVQDLPKLPSDISFDVSAADLSGSSAVSLIIASENKPYLRVARPPQEPTGEHQHHNHHKLDRFRGIPTEQDGRYWDATTGQATEMSDREMALYFAQSHLGLSSDQIQSMEKVTRFGTFYDFRNKRLPVWELRYANSTKDRVFIDPATGALVDRVSQNEVPDILAFSFLHKWNFLVPVLGRNGRDTLVAAVLIGTLGLAFLGFRLAKKRSLG